MKKIAWFKILMIAMIAYFGYIGYQQQVNLNSIAQEKAEAEVKLNETRQINEQLTAEKADLSDPQKVEKIAREELGMVKPGELPYISSKKE